MGGVEEIAELGGGDLGEPDEDDGVVLVVRGLVVGFGGFGEEGIAVVGVDGYYQGVGFGGFVGGDAG